MYNDPPFNLSHASAKAPTGSPAQAALQALRQEGFDIIQNPTLQGELTHQFINHEYGAEVYDWASTATESSQAYVAWRERQPERDIFVLADRLGNLAAASWIGPRHYETDTVAVAATLALGGIRLYHGHTQLAKQFLQVTQAYAYRRYDYVKQGILMQVSTLPLIRACAAVGYRPLTSVGDHRSGNLSLDMVVSSGPLAALNIGKYVAMPQRPERPSRSAKPYLRIVKEDMGD